MSENQSCRIVGMVTYLQRGFREPVYEEESYQGWLKPVHEETRPQEHAPAAESFATLVALNGVVRYLYAEQVAHNMLVGPEEQTPPSELRASEFPRNGFAFDAQVERADGAVSREPAYYFFVNEPTPGETNQ